MCGFHPFLHFLEFLPLSHIEEVDGVLHAIPIFDHARDAIVFRLTDPALTAFYLRAKGLILELEMKGAEDAL
jgi:hypothetical protein